MPRWRPDGKGLYYVSPDRKLMEVEVAVGPSSKVGAPKPLFQTSALQPNPAGGWPWDVSPDGQRFLANTPTGQQRTAPLTVLISLL